MTPEERIADLEKTVGWLVQYVYQVADAISGNTRAPTPEEVQEFVARAEREKQRRIEEERRYAAERKAEEEAINEAVYQFLNRLRVVVNLGGSGREAFSGEQLERWIYEPGRSSSKNKLCVAYGNLKRLIRCGPKVSHLVTKVFQICDEPSYLAHIDGRENQWRIGNPDGEIEDRNGVEFFDLVVKNMAPERGQQERMAA